MLVASTGGLHQRRRLGVLQGVDRTGLEVQQAPTDRPIRAGQAALP